MENIRKNNIDRLLEAVTVLLDNNKEEQVIYTISSDLKNAIEDFLEL